MLFPLRLSVYLSFNWLGMIVGLMSSILKDSEKTYLGCTVFIKFTPYINCLIQREPFI